MFVIKFWFTIFLCIGQTERFGCPENGGPDIPIDSLCDGIADCLDGDDETNALCAGIYIKCYCLPSASEQL